MNELDKTTQNNDVVTPETSNEVNLENTEANATVCENKNECVETESPAEAISEVADAVAEVVASEKAECADEASERTEVKETTVETEEKTEIPSPRFHTMSKEELVNALEEIVKADNTKAYREVNAIRQAFYTLRNREIETAQLAHIDAGNSPESFVSEADPSEGRLKELCATFKERRTAELEADAARRQANLERRNDIIAKMKELTEDIDNINLNLNAFRELQQQFRALKEIPAQAESDSWKEYQLVNEKFYDSFRVNKELRDLAYKKNLEAKEALIKKAEELGTAEDIIDANRQIIDLHNQWREIGPVARELREEIWERFRAASSVVRKRHNDYFLGRKAEEEALEAAKIALCEQIENYDIAALTSFSKWDEATKEIIEIQKKWKEISVAPHKSRAQLFARYRKACDAFFAAKAEYNKATRKLHQENLAKKIDLCERAEALIDSENTKTAAEAVKKLQQEWRTVGAVARKDSDAVWKRFCKACDTVYDNRKRHSAGVRKELVANLEAKRAIIVQLKELPLDGDRKEVIDKVKELQEQYRKIGHVPYAQMEKVHAEYRAECDRLYDGYSNRERNRRMSNFKGKVDNFAGDELGRERFNLKRELDEKRNEYRTVENNLGFFKVKSNSGNSMVKEIERRLAQIKSDIAMIEEKIALLDSKME